VSLINGRLAVGAVQDDEMGEESGSAYVFTRSGQEWSQQYKFLAPDGTNGDQLGSSMALTEDYLAVGAPEVDSVYVLQ
jgi:hypothetical protein